MELKTLLEDISDWNDQLTGDAFYLERDDLISDNIFEHYLNYITEQNFFLELKGNTTEFFGKNVIDDIQYMFVDLFKGQNVTVFATQQDTHIIYIDHDTGKIGACLAGDTLHYLADDLLSFFRAIYAVQTLLIDDYNGSRDDEPSHEDFLHDILTALRTTALNKPYFMEFFYDATIKDNPQFEYLYNANLGLGR